VRCCASSRRTARKARLSSRCGRDGGRYTRITIFPTWARLSISANASRACQKVVNAIDHRLQPVLRNRPIHREERLTVADINSADTYGLHDYLPWVRLPFKSGQDTKEVDIPSVPDRLKRPLECSPATHLDDMIDPGISSELVDAQLPVREFTVVDKIIRTELASLVAASCCWMR
jgi:hypothetical protein